MCSSGVSQRFGQRLVILFRYFSPWLSSFCYFSLHFSVAAVAQNSFLWFFQPFRLCIFYQNIIHKADTAWEVTSGGKPLKENKISPSTLTSSVKSTPIAAYFWSQSNTLKYVFQYFVKSSVIYTRLF